jgi:hypothetical protein
MEGRTADSCALREAMEKRLDATLAAVKTVRQFAERRTEGALQFVEVGVPPGEVKKSRARNANVANASRCQAPTSIELRSHHILNALSSAFASKSYH